MILEKGSFTPNNDATIVTLNNENLTPDRVIFWVEGTYPSHGSDDGTQAVAAYGSTNTKNDRSIYVHNGSSALMSGRITDLDVGEFEVTFDVRTATSIGFLAIQD